MIAPKTDTRKYLCSIYVTPTRLLTSSGYSLLMVEHESDSLQEPVMLCRHDLERKLKMFTAKSDLILSFDSNGTPYLKDSIDGEEVVLLVVIGRYPDMERVLRGIDDGNSKYSMVGLNVVLMATLCKAVNTINADKKCPIGIFSFSGRQGGCSITRGDIFGYLMPAKP